MRSSEVVCWLSLSFTSCHTARAMNSYMKSGLSDKEFYHIERAKKYLQTAREGYELLQGNVFYGRDVEKIQTLGKLSLAAGDYPNMIKTAKEIDELLTVLEKVERGEASKEEAKRVQDWFMNVGKGCLEKTNELLYA